MNQNRELRKFLTPEVIFGIDAIDLAGSSAARLGGRKILVVSDEGVQKAGWTQRVVGSLEDEGLQYAVFPKVSPNPRDFQVMEGAEVYRQNGCDCIVAIGGGSPTDCGKGIGIVVSNGGNILDFEGVDRVNRPVPPIICIPTTAGASADVSQFAIITDTAAHNKIAIISKAIVPDIALVDPRTLTTMDAYLAACTGMDALVHAIEAFVSTGSSSMTDVYALNAIRLIWKYLKKSIEDPENLELRSQMMQGSLQAGLAFSNASLGAVHAMAHSLGGFLDLPHGECNALLLQHVVKYNFLSVPERFREIARCLEIQVDGLTDKDVCRKLLADIDRLRLEIGIPNGLHQRGLKSGDIPELAIRAKNDPCLVTNPQPATAKDLEAIYEEAT